MTLPDDASRTGLLTATPMEVGARRVLHLAGELDVAGAPNLLAAVLRSGGGRVEVDLSAVSFMDCAGYRAFAAGAAADPERSFRLSNATGQPHAFLRLLDVLALTDRDVEVVWAAIG